MKKNISIILVLFFSSIILFANDTTSKPTPLYFNLGDSLSNDVILDTNNSKCLYLMPYSNNPNCLFPALFNGITYYFFTINVDTNSFCDERIIRSIYVEDSSFVSPEGLKVGDSFKKAISKANKISYWASAYYEEGRKYLVLPSGWMAEVSHRVPKGETKKLVPTPIIFDDEIDVNKYEDLKIHYFLKYDLFWVQSPSQMFIDPDYSEMIKEVLPDHLTLDTDNFSFISVYPFTGIHYKFYPVAVNNITYYINLEESVLSNSVNSKDIRTVYVRDSNFTTPEGISLNNSLPKKYLTWDYLVNVIRIGLGKDIAIVKLPSGWLAKVVINFENEIDRNRYFIDKQKTSTITDLVVQYFYLGKYLQYKFSNNTEN